MTVIGTISYFLHDPYRSEKRKMQDAKSQIRDIEKAAGKEIRKNQRAREKEEKRAQKRLEQEKRERGFFAWFKKQQEQSVEAEPVTEVNEPEKGENLSI